MSGNVVFRPGMRKSNDAPIFTAYPAGCFIFHMADGKEFMRVEPDGQVYVRGTLVDTDRKVYENFREWLSHAKFTFDKAMDAQCKYEDPPLPLGMPKSDP
jgi:hypothetical protein